MKEVFATLIALANCFVHFQLTARILKVYTAPVQIRVIVLLMIRIRLRFAQLLNAVCNKNDSKFSCLRIYWAFSKLNIEQQNMLNIQDVPGER